ncbi:MAG: hypothetical protein CMI02_08650 [Oceanospirillaceae bacterium]|nr:hypothetical protein [Oceanospirillaceae bacterium]
MTIQNVLDWLQEAEDNNCWQVSTQSVKRHLEEVQKQQLILYGVTQQSEQFAFEDGKEFKEWQKKQGITRIGDSRYKWKDFEYDRRFFLEKYLEDRNKANCG